MIARLPNSPWSSAETAAIASRLILLLPTNPSGSTASTTLRCGRFATGGWVRTALLYGALVAFLAFNALLQNHI
jgi:hypothetical protein